MYYYYNRIVRLSFLIAAFFLMSCESEALPVSPSFLDDNSFMVESFTEIDDILVFQDNTSTVGNSYRLYSGNIHDDNSTAYLKINTNLVRSSKYCNFDSESYDENSIASVDTVKLVLRTFTQLQDPDDSLTSFIDKENLVIKGGFVNLHSWDGDSTTIFEDEISNLLDQELITINSDMIDYDDNTIHMILPLSDGSLLTNEWCEHDCFLGDYYISVNYNPGPDKEQYIEFLSSQNYYQSTTVFRPSLRFIYNQLQDSLISINKWSLDENNGATLASIEDLNIYYVHNQSLETNSKILLANNVGNNFNNSVYNDMDTYISEINLEESNFSAGSYELNLNFKFNEDILDSISVIDFFIDSIKVISNVIDPSGDNSYEGNASWDYVDGNDNDDYDLGEDHEYFYDLGSDNCPDNYEDPDSPNLCLCDDYINNPDSCLDENIIYNSSGTEGNGEHDYGELFPNQYDYGSDGCPDEYETGDQSNPCNLNQTSNCSDGLYGDNCVPDPANDNYNIDPSNDNWHDYGSDGCPDEYETGDQSNPCNFEQISYCSDGLYGNNCIADPNGDNWGYGNIINGTEGNDKWDEDEGTEGNGLWDCSSDGSICESFSDLGIDGILESQEGNCSYCNDDLDTEGNGVWDYIDQNGNNQYDLGENCEPFQDTGIDQVYTVYEEGYNPSGTEGNNFRDFGEEFPSEYDCGEDGECNEQGDGNDPSNDNYNIDPNNDNWSDCGADGDCEIIDEDGTQSNGLWELGEGEQGNSQYDLGEDFNDLGTDNLSDIIENLTSDTSLDYYIPQSISYDIYSSLEPGLGPQTEVDSSKNVIFDIKSISFDNDNAITTVLINITADSDFKALEFRLNHLPYLESTSNQVHSKDLIHRINQDELFEDISIYNNSYLESDLDIFSDNNNLVLDYFNGVKFSFKFPELKNWINNNPNASINYNYTTLVLYFNHDHPNYDFFDDNANIWLSMGDNNRLLGVADAIPFLSQVGPLEASGQKQILIPFGTIIREIMDGDLNIDDNITFMLDGGWNNTSRIVLHGYDSSDEATSEINVYAPRLEIFYTK